MTHISRRRRVMLLCLLCCLIMSCSTAQENTEQKSAPSSQELSAEIKSQSQVVSDFDQVRSILVAHSGELVYEQYFGTDADTYWDLQSVTKSVVSTLIGIAIGEGLIGGPDDTLAQLLPQDFDVMSPAVRTTTLRQLLTMDAGFPSGTEALGPDFSRSKNWVGEILANPERPPGQGFTYSNGNTHLLAAILQQATGKSALDYAREKLFGPLGIDTTPAWTHPALRDNIEAYEKSDFAWPTDPQGTNTGWSLLKLRPSDLVRLGQLFLDDGRWEGKQIVPQQWVHEATTQQIQTDVSLGDGYGYQWWTGDLDGSRTFRAMGYGGQLIVVVPDRDLVVATTTELRLLDPTSNGIDLGVLLAIIEDAVVSQFAPQP